MDCPYCGEKMQDGTLFLGRKEGPRFLTEQQLSRSRSDRFWDALGGIGNLKVDDSRTWSSSRTPASFCPRCRKMIIDTDVYK